MPHAKTLDRLEHVLERQDHRGVRQGHLARRTVFGGMRKPIMKEECYG
jgi:hypothetical protein